MLGHDGCNPAKMAGAAGAWTIITALIVISIIVLIILISLYVPIFESMTLS